MASNENVETPCEETLRETTIKVSDDWVLSEEEKIESARLKAAFELMEADKND